MKKFRFKFAEVLKLREMKEKEALRALASAQQAHQDALGRKAQLQAELSESFERKRKLSTLTVDVAGYQLEEIFIAGTKQRLVQAEHAIIKAVRGVEKALKVYLIARRQTRTIEILKEKDFEKYKKERLRYEQKQLDELMIMRDRLRRESA